MITYRPARGQITIISDAIALAMPMAQYRAIGRSPNRLVVIQHPAAWCWPHRLEVLIKPFKSRDQQLPTLYVAPDLDHQDANKVASVVWADDIVLPGADGQMKTFRRLDLRWLTWLARRMAAAEAKASPAMVEVYRARFAEVRAFAFDRWGDDASLALASLPDGRYRAPSAAA